MMRHALRIYSTLYFVILGLDIITKQWALRSCKELWYLHSNLFCYQVFNRGVACSFFASDSPAWYALVVAGVASFIAYFLWYTWQRWLLGRSLYAEVLILAGATGNMLDRLFYPGVIDFIGIRIHTFVWPLFNCADVAIVCGVALMVLHLVKEKKEWKD